MLDFGFYNMDCMDGMREFPDQYFDLAITDPPYGINIGSSAMGAGEGVAPHKNRSSIQAKKIGGGAGQSEEQNPLERIRVGGGLWSVPKFIRHLMTATHQMPNISKN